MLEIKISVVCPELTTALNRLADAYAGAQVQIGGSADPVKVDTAKTEKATEPKAKKPEKQVEPEKEETEKALTMEEIRDKLAPISDVEGGSKKIREAIASLGAKNLSALDPSKYGALLEILGVK